MTDKIEVVRVKPCDLTRGQVIRLNCTYKTELGDFIAIGSMAQDRLYVNEDVPEEDVQKFLQICSYDGDYINDDSCPIADVNDYVYGKYGCPAWSTLVDIYSKRKEQQGKAKAKVVADEYFKKIDKYRYDDEADAIFGDLEYVVSEIAQAANKTGRKTFRNLVGIDKEYVFYLGYLMGKGIINKSEG
ncbi:hypothetical protein DWX43_19155 [Clostridium sp. AF19-22AC]|jgi:hypothetical protein|uniref:hypothetical protein n=1 Tax=Clostridia TaxID=186801 RepID=UPI000E4F867B|nr:MULTISPECIES: hypothetical protein [Clostridia]RHR24761.1 hypothetical protein DWX43_19155 [Clostridium sp. AF19-22AC]DAQ34352.1 MAG TPA: hypothetical protein [Caudoviricetes sp.]